MMEINFFVLLLDNFSIVKFKHDVLLILNSFKRVQTQSNAMIWMLGLRHRRTSYMGADVVCQQRYNPLVAWIYKVKLQANGNIEKSNARLVAKGCNQRESLDYNETFLPIIKNLNCNCQVYPFFSRSVSLAYSSVRDVYKTSFTSLLDIAKFRQLTTYNP